MITIKKALALCALGLPLLSYANNLDYKNYPDSASSDASRFSAKSLIIPGSLMLYGTAETLLAPKYRMLNYALGHEVAYHQPPKFTVDNITQYIPAASVYILNWSGLKGRHNFKDRTFILGIAGLITAASVNTLKYTTKVQRPDRSAFNTFPSGHTAVAFMGAEYLWQEYKHVSPWIGAGGYLLASATGALRIYNNRHWVGDIAFGAGLGILSTKLAYWIYPAMQQKRKKRRAEKVGAKSKNNVLDNFAFAPYYNGQQGGVELLILFGH